MNASLRSKLHKKIDEWVDENSVRDEGWLDGYVGENLVPLMVKAAEAVADAQVDVNKYFEREKMLK